MKKKTDFTKLYKSRLKDFCRDLGEQLRYLRLEKNWSLEEAAEHVKEFMLAHQEEWEGCETDELIRLEHLIQMAMCYDKKVKITFE